MFSFLALNVSQSLCRVASQSPFRGESWLRAQTLG